MKKMLVYKMIAIAFTLSTTVPATASDFTTMTALAEQGDRDAQHNLGAMYETGQGIQQDDVKALEWYYKAALQGNEWAELKIAERCHNGNLSICDKYVRLIQQEPVGWMELATPNIIK